MIPKCFKSTEQKPYHVVVSIFYANQLVVKDCLLSALTLKVFFFFTIICIIQCQKGTSLGDPYQNSDMVKTQPC